MNIINYIWIEGKRMDVINHKRTLMDGRVITIEGEVKFDDIMISAVFNGNVACKNYLDRRKDAVHIKRHYYGKINGLGYLVGCDEFKEGDFDKEYFEAVERLKEGRV